MYKRVVLKTVLICVGIFILLISGSAYYLSKNYKIDTEKSVTVIVASTNVTEGTIINDSLLTEKVIKESDITPALVFTKEEIIGTKTLNRIEAGDYIRSYELLPKDKWFTREEKTITIPATIDERLANLVKKGSYVDIKVELTNEKKKPLIVLSKVHIEDVLDESGLSLGETIGNKKGYFKVYLEPGQRDKLYCAMKDGKLRYELYCDDTQKPPQEEYQIPAEYLKPIANTSTSINTITGPLKNPLVQPIQKNTQAAKQNKAK